MREQSGLAGLQPLQPLPGTLSVLLQSLVLSPRPDDEMLVQNSQRPVQRGWPVRSVVIHPASDLRLYLGSQLPKTLTASSTQRPTPHRVAHRRQRFVADGRAEGREDPSPTARAPWLERERSEERRVGKECRL